MCVSCIVHFAGTETNCSPPKPKPRPRSLRKTETTNEAIPKRIVKDNEKDVLECYKEIFHLDDKSDQNNTVVVENNVNRAYKENEFSDRPNRPSIEDIVLKYSGRITSESPFLDSKYEFEPKKQVAVDNVYNIKKGYSEKINREVNYQSEALFFKTNSVTRGLLESVNLDKSYSVPSRETIVVKELNIEPSVVKHIAPFGSHPDSTEFDRNPLENEKVDFEYPYSSTNATLHDDEYRTIEEPINLDSEPSSPEFSIYR